MLNAAVPKDVEVPVTGDVVEGSLQEASAKILKDIFNEEVVNLDDIPSTSPDEKDYMVETKELLLEKYGVDGSDEAAAWVADNVGSLESFANEKAFWFAAYLKLTNKN